MLAHVNCFAGKGSYGAVYKARDIKTSELVAIKVISLCEGVCLSDFIHLCLVIDI